MGNLPCGRLGLRLDSSSLVGLGTRAGQAGRHVEVAVLLPLCQASISGLGLLCLSARHEPVRMAHPTPVRGLSRATPNSLGAGRPRGRYGSGVLHVGG